MLPSQELRQQQSEAIKIAEEQKAPRKKAEPAASKSPTTIDGRAPDLTGGVEVTGLRFPANVMMANSQSALAIGNEYSNQMSISGVIKRMVLMPGGFHYATVQTQAGLRWVVVMPSGMTAELVP
jgi:hypothetical protein